MATVSATWNKSSGDWFVDGNWDEADGTGHYIPGENNDVYITGSSAYPPYYITYTGTSAINSLTGTGMAVLSINGSLELLNQSNFYQINVSPGSSLSVDNGSLTLSNGDIGGTVSGDTLHFVDGTFNINPDAAINTTSWTIGYKSGSTSAPNVIFGTDLSYDGNFSLQSTQVAGVYSPYTPVLSLQGHEVTLSGTSTLGGEIDGSGTLKLSGTGSINQPLIVDAATLEIAGTTNLSSGVTLTAADLLIDSSGTLNMNGGYLTYDLLGPDPTSGHVDNHGTINITTKSGIGQQFSNSGTIDIGSGGLTLTGGSPSLGGTITGSGTLTFSDISRYQILPYTIAAGFNPTMGGWSIGNPSNPVEEMNVSFLGDVSYTGKFSLWGEVDLNGHTLTITNTSASADLNGTVHDGGKFIFSGTGNIPDTFTIGDSSTFENVGSITQWIPGGLTLGSKAGDTATFINDAGAIYTLKGGGLADITDGTSYQGSAGTTQVINKGTIIVADEGEDSSAGIGPKITNEGTISIATGAFLGLGGGSSDFGGTVTGAGTLSMSGSYVLGSDLSISTANWIVNTRYNKPTDGITLGSDLTYAGNFTDNTATIDLAGHTFTLSGTAQISGVIEGSGAVLLTGTGTIGNLELTQHASLDISGSYTETGKLTFGDYGTLILTPTTSFGSVIDEFRSDDKIEIDGFSAKSATFNNGVYTLSDGTTAVSLNFGNDQTASDLSFYTDSSGDTFVTTAEAPCYCPGTMIATDRGDIPVEDLVIGDQVLTLSGRMGAIKWIGRRDYSGRFILGRKDILPICIEAGALGHNVPVRDLWVSPHHAFYLGEILVEAKDLLNDVTIYQADIAEEVTYFHVELDSHDVILADGAWAESFINDGSRGMFHNARQYSDLYGEDEHEAAARYCAPRLDCGDQVEAIRTAINTRIPHRKRAA